MNERIKELMAQAGFDPASIERMGVMPQAEKFAKLIVKECQDIAVRSMGGHELPMDEATRRSWNIWIDIEEHFK